MKSLTLNRIIFNQTTTIGELFDINNNKLCWTLEDVVRPNNIKIDGRTAIPEGKYRVIVSMSNRFKRLMIELLNVPNFKGIRCHSGNTSKDTEGCIIVAKRKIDDTMIVGSYEKELIAYVSSLLKIEKEVFINIVNKK